MSIFDDVKKEWKYFCQDMNSIWKDASVFQVDFFARILMTLLFSPAFVLGFILAISGAYQQTQK